MEAAVPAAPAAVLRPRGIGELLDQAIRLYRKNFLKFIGIIALVQIPVSLVSLLVAISSLQNAREITTRPVGTLPSSFYMTYLITFALSIVSLFLIQGFGNAALTRAIADSYLGEQVSILGAYMKIGRKWLTLVWALVLLGLISIVAVIFWIIVPCLGWVTGIGILMFLGIVVMPLLGPVVVLEGNNGVDAIKRAWDLARSKFWRVVGFVAILYIFNMLVVSGPVMLVSALTTPIVTKAAVSGQAIPYWTAIIQNVLSTVLGILYFSLQSTAIAMLYFDLRIRTEGFDLAVSAYQADLQAQPQETYPESELAAAAAADRPTTMVDLIWKAPQMPPKPTITWNDMGQFALLSIAMMFVYGLIYIVALAAVLGPMIASGGLPTP